MKSARQYAHNIGVARGKRRGRLERPDGGREVVGDDAGERSERLVYRNLEVVVVSRLRADRHGRSIVVHRNVTRAAVYVRHGIELAVRIGADSLYRLPGERMSTIMCSTIVYGFSSASGALVITSFSSAISLPFNSSLPFTLSLIHI